MRSTAGQRAELLLKVEQGIVGSRARALEEGFQFARIQPQSVATVAEIDFDVLEMQDEKRDIALWANSDHNRVVPLARDDAVVVHAPSSASGGRERMLEMSRHIG